MFHSRVLLVYRIGLLGYPLAPEANAAMPMVTVLHAENAMRIETERFVVWHGSHIKARQIKSSKKQQLTAWQSLAMTNLKSRIEQEFEKAAA